MESKLRALLEQEGLDTAKAAQEVFAFEDAVPGICENEHCSYTCMVTRDSRVSWCDICEAHTVISIMRLARESCAFVPEDQL